MGFSENQYSFTIKDCARIASFKAELKVLPDCATCRKKRYNMVQNAFSFVN